MSPELELKIIKTSEDDGDKHRSVVALSPFLYLRYRLCCSCVVPVWPFLISKLCKLKQQHFFLLNLGISENNTSSK